MLYKNDETQWKQINKQIASFADTKSTHAQIRNRFRFSLIRPNYRNITAFITDCFGADVI